MILCVFLYLCTFAHALLQGPTASVPASEMVLSEMSQKGQRMIAISSNHEAYLYADLGLGLVVQDVIQNTSMYEDFDMDYKGERVVLIGDNIAEIYDIGVSSFINIQNITLNSSIKSVSLSEYYQYLSLCDSSGKIEIYSEVNNSYQFVNQLNQASNSIVLKWEFKEDYFMVGADNQLKIYDANSNFVLANQVSNTETIKKIHLNYQTDRLFLLSSTLLSVYYGSITSYTLLQSTNLQANDPQFMQVSFGKDAIMIAGSPTPILQVYKIDSPQITYSLNETFNLNVSSIANDLGLLYIKIFMGNQMLSYHRCDSWNCKNCSSPLVCVVCPANFTLTGNICFYNPVVVNITNNTNNTNNTNDTNDTVQSPKQNSECLDGKRFDNGNCMVYCAEECSSCSKTADNCTKCSEFYEKNKAGKCVSSFDVNDEIAYIRAYLQILRTKSFRAFLLFIADLRLYEYHKRVYKGQFASILKFIRLVEDKQWAVIKVQVLGEKVDKIVDQMPSYTHYSSKRFQEVERKDEFFFRVNHQYFFYSLPATIIIMFLFNKIFYCLFNYEISKHLRMFSFWGYLLELAIQSNIQLFTFFAFRQFRQPISFNFNNKIYLAFVILFFWIVLIFAFTSYYLFSYFYRKLSKYFLVNHYRIKSAFTSNIIAYGARPFLKGVVHSVCQDYYEVQLGLLFAIQILTIFFLCYFEFQYGVHRKKFVFLLEIGVYGSFACLDAILVYTYWYGHDEHLSFIVRVLLSFVVLRLIADFIPCLYLQKFENGKKEKKAIKQKKITKLKTIFESLSNTFNSINPPPSKKSQKRVIIEQITETKVQFRQEEKTENKMVKEEEPQRKNSTLIHDVIIEDL